MSSEQALDQHVGFRQLSTFQRFLRYSKSLSIRLQACAIFLSLVGIGFGFKSYVNVRDELGTEASASFLTDLYVQIVFAIIVNLLVGVVINRICTRPVQRLTDSMDGIVQGDLEKEVPFILVKNEIGSMARRVHVFRKNAIEKRHLEEKQEQERLAAQEEKRKTMNDLAESFESSVGMVVSSLQETIGKFDSAADSLNMVVEDTNLKVQSASKATTQTLDNMNNISSASTEMNASIDNISRKSIDSAETVSDAKVKALDANGRVTELATAMNEINEIITIIQNIAEQTNLLALNATIEAARAGDAGKGFAVVASEVKSLANETAKATDQITDRIHTLQDETQLVVQSIEQIVTTVEDIAQNSEVIQEAIEHERVAVTEITKSIGEATELSQNTGKNIEGVSEGSQKTEAATDNVVTGVDALKTQTNNLNQSIQEFLNKIRSN